MNIDKIKAIFLNHPKKATIIAALFVFAISFALYFSIYHSKGFLITRYDEVLIARNWAQTGILGYENVDNVVISTKLMSTQGVVTTLGNKLTYYIYGMIFRAFGFHQSLPMYVSFFLYAVSAALLFLLIKKLFGWSIGLLAAAINLVAPFFLPYILSVGKSEWAYFFFIVATLIYFWPVRDKKIGRLIWAGLFFGASVAARNSYFVIILPIIFLELFVSQQFVWKKKIMRSLILSVAFLLVAAPFSFSGGNSYLGLIFGGQKFEASHILDHIYPDPYTAHTEGSQYINGLIDKSKSYSFSQKVSFWGDSGMFLRLFDSARVGFFWGRVIPTIFSFVFYLRAFLSLIVFGGVLMWLLVVLGFKKISANKSNKSFLIFAVVSLISWYVSLSLAETSNYPHYLMLVYPLVVLAGAGIYVLAEYVSDYFALKDWRRLCAMILVSIAFLLPMLEISWWHLRDYYQNSMAEVAGESFVKNHKSEDFSQNGVIMVGYFPKASVLFNYHFDRSFIYFHPDTIKSLATQGKLESVFKSYKISGFLGYDEDITSLISQQTHNQLKQY